MLTVQTPQLNFNSDGTPYSEYFHDPYFSLVDAISESKYVFLEGNNVINRWDKENFTIAELGFGFGVNFIATSNAWIKTNQYNRHLHFISIEKFPVGTDDLERCYHSLNISSKFTQRLIDQYPLPVQGFHRIKLDEFNISLTLIFGDALPSLGDCSFTADAWYLDGFSPNKNPDLWTPEIANEVHRLTNTDGTIATYSAASEVQHNFSNAGFKISKQNGFGKKREMLIGTYLNKSATKQFKLKDESWLTSDHSKTRDKRAIVIGGGMAGASISAALAKRKWQVTIIERNSTLASEGSGNANAILMPRLSADHDTQSQLTLLGFLYSIRHFNNLQKFSDGFNWEQCGAIQIPRDPTQRKRMHLIASQEKIPEQLLKAVSQNEASDLSNCHVSSDGWLLPLAGWLAPKQLCSALINQYSDNISFIGNIEISSIENNNSIWTAFNKGKDAVCSADIIIIANAAAANQFLQTEWCTLHSKRGQLTLIPSDECNIQPNKIICADAYVTPATNSHYVVGATFIAGDTAIDVRESEHQENLIKLKKIIPTCSTKSTQSLKGRAAIRAVSFDRLPIVGPVAEKKIFNNTYKNAALGSTHDHYPTPSYHQGLYISSGFGSRGLAWIPLCTEALACIINNEANPISKSLLGSIHPNRILMKHLIKSVQSQS